MTVTNSTPLSSQTVTVPPAYLGSAGIYKVQLAGQVLVCRASTAPLNCKLDAGSFFPIEAGFVIPGPAAGFKIVTLQNTTGSPIICTLYAGEQGINVIQNNYGKVFPTYAKGTDLIGGLALTAGSSYTFNGADSTNPAAGGRKQITVQNCDNSNYITVQDGSGNALVLLAPNSAPWTIETAGVIVVRNTAVATINRVIVGEVFYAA